MSKSLGLSLDKGFVFRNIVIINNLHVCIHLTLVDILQILYMYYSQFILTIAQVRWGSIFHVK